MPCEQERQLEYEREQERKRKRKKEEEKKKQERFQKALKTVREQAKKFGWRLTEVRANCFVASKPYSEDKMEINVLKNGIIKTNTEGTISMPNHSSAETFLGEIAKKLKAKWTIFHKHPHGVAHGHAHTHIH